MYARQNQSRDKNIVWGIIERTQETVSQNLAMIKGRLMLKKLEKAIDQLKSNLETDTPHRYN